ncbi:hypothetical protein F2P44_08175 [Massilia sp. CCM 8695]|uniref:Carboxypeptidase regulatory-like domain-containing protein n=1 Tax=Massilia frigida TaxID=2609281 RepID=A0ABX0N9F6_9BURK|nr:carboxypeptidase-like regulatory domain-containing protein [Massilia frigida]NHZ79252.1 hypothetical protein [Massilia frigida]
MVTLDPVTTTSSNCWKQAGRTWKYRLSLPPSEGFTSARRSVTADADGRFKFSKLPAGSYYLRTELTWDVAYHGIQGGVLAAEHEVKPGETKTVMLNSL